jgi:hypothetical protein
VDAAGDIPAGGGKLVLVWELGADQKYAELGERQQASFAHRPCGETRPFAKS